MAGEDFPVTIYHNPDCGTSRNVLAIIEAAGYRPKIIEYLSAGWTRPRLLALFSAAGLTPRMALRERKSPAEALGLLDPAVSDERLVEEMLRHPILVNRPIVVSPKGVKLCRPSERVFDLLERSLPTFVKEDGEVVTGGPSVGG